MLKAAARLLLLRVLPRRLLPIVTIAEAILLIRSVRRRPRGKVKVNDRTNSAAATAPARVAAPSSPGAETAATAAEQT